MSNLNFKNVVFKTGKPIWKTIIYTFLFGLLYGILNFTLHDFTIYQGADFSFRIQIIIPFLAGYFLGPIPGFVVGFFGNSIGDYLTGVGFSNVMTYSVANGIFGFLMGCFPYRKKVINKPQQLAFLYMFIFGTNIIAIVYAFLINTLFFHADGATQLFEMVMPIVISNIIVCSITIPAILYFFKKIKNLLTVKLLLFLYYFSYFISIGSVALILIFLLMNYDLNINDLGINPGLFLFNMLIIPIILINTLGFVFSYYATDKLIKPLTLFSKGIQNISENNFKTKIEINASPEILLLAESFNTMIDQLQIYTKEIEERAREKEKLNTELNVASRIQQSILPHNAEEFSKKSAIDVYGEMIPAKEVGGDFYNYFFIDDSHICFIVADVSGKGIAAGLFMMITSTLMEIRVGETLDIEQVFISVNNQLCERNSEGYFVTAFMGILDLEAEELHYINAGHNPPLIKRKDGGFEELPCDVNFVLGGMEDINFKSETIELVKGDMLFIFTDGVTEATSTELQLYSLELLIKVLNDKIKVSKTSKELVEDVLMSIDEFVIGAEQSDDITILNIKI